MENLINILQNDELRGIVIALVGSTALITAFNDALANFASKVPAFGWILAIGVRRLTPAFFQWLRKVADSAEKVVKEVDYEAAKTPGMSTGKRKKARAIKLLKKREPGLTNSKLDSEIEAALERVKGDMSIKERARLFPNEVKKAGAA